VPQNRGVYREKPKNLEKTLTMERKTNNKFNPHNVPWPDSYQRGNVRGVGVISWGVLPIIAHMGRLCPKGVPFLGFKYMKGWGFHWLKYMKGYGIPSFWSVKRPKRTNSRILRL